MSPIVKKIVETSFDFNCIDLELDECDTLDLILERQQGEPYCVNNIIIKGTAYPPPYPHLVDVHKDFSKLFAITGVTIERVTNGSFTLDLNLEYDQNSNYVYDGYAIEKDTNRQDQEVLILYVKDGTDQTKQVAFTGKTFDLAKYCPGGLAIIIKTNSDPLPWKDITWKLGVLGIQ
jgi:hypothetical protein